MAVSFAVSPPAMAPKPSSHLLSISRATYSLIPQLDATGQDPDRWEGRKEMHVALGKQQS